MHPFAFWKSSAAVFNIASLSWSGLWYASYAGAPWAARASAGASGANGNLITNINDPSTGTAQNGLTPADFDGTNDNLRNLTLDTTFYTTTAGSIVALFRADTAAAPSGNVYDDPSIFRNLNSNVGLSYTTSGFGGYAYDGAYKSKYVAAATGSYHLVMVDWDGSNLGMTLNSAARVTSACGTLTLGGDSINVGLGYGGTCIDGRLLMVGTSATKFSGANYTNIKSWANATFALAL